MDDNESMEDDIIRSNIFCNNCSKYGHVFNKCKMPVVSYGVILFRKRCANLEYLMICRRNTLGYIDFMRGKYVPTNKYYIMNMLKQMSQNEIQGLETKTFDELWLELWNDIYTTSDAASSGNNQYKSEEYSSRIKFNILLHGTYGESVATVSHFIVPASTASTQLLQTTSVFYNLKMLLEELKSQHTVWAEPEWGFPKGRRHYHESEYNCAVREFLEETGMSTKNILPIYNLLPVEELFIGSNYKSYKHKYFIMYLNDHGEDSECDDKDMKEPFCSEVSKRSWKTKDECLKAMRTYNVEKKELLQNVHEAITKYAI